MNPSYLAFFKAVQGYTLNSIVGIPYVSKKDELNQTTGKLFAGKGLVEATKDELDAKEALVSNYLANLAAEAKLRSQRR